MKEYYSLKHGRIIGESEQHEIDFEYSRVLEGLPGERRSLATPPPRLVDRLRDILQVGRIVKKFGPLYSIHLISTFGLPRRKDNNGSE